MADETIELIAKKGRDPKFMRFTPRRAIRLLIRKEKSTPVMREWALATLLFWTFFDERGAKKDELRRAKDVDKPTSSRRTIYTSDARRGGNLFLLHELVQAYDGTHHANFTAALSMLFRTEGFANAILGYPPDAFMREYNEKKSNHDGVLAIVRFLLEVGEIDQRKAQLQFAREYARLYVFSPTKGKRIEDKTVQGIWTLYKQNTPLLFAFLQEESFDPSIFGAVSLLSAWVKRVSQDPTTVLRILGVAAAVANHLSKTAKGMRLNYYKDIEPIQWSSNPFDEKEAVLIRDLQIIKDKSSDAADYRAKSVKRKS